MLYIFYVKDDFFQAFFRHVNPRYTRHVHRLIAVAFKPLRTTILSSRVQDRRSIVPRYRRVRAQARVRARAQAITLMIIYDRGGINVSRARIDLFTPEGDPHAIPHVGAAPRRARVATATAGNLSSPLSPSTSFSPSLFSLVLLPVVYFSPLNATIFNVFVCGRGVYDWRLSLKFSGIYELHRRPGITHFRRRAV